MMFITLLFNKNTLPEEVYTKMKSFTSKTGTEICEKGKKQKKKTWKENVKLVTNSKSAVF